MSKYSEYADTKAARAKMLELQSESFVDDVGIEISYCSPCDDQEEVMNLYLTEQNNRLFLNREQAILLRDWITEHLE